MGLALHILLLGNTQTSSFFRQVRHKKISSFSFEKKTVSYKQIQEFTFDYQASAPLRDDDELVVLNVPLNVSK